MFGMIINTDKYILAKNQEWMWLCWQLSLKIYLVNSFKKLNPKMDMEKKEVLVSWECFM